ncbi:DMP19 family protein [Falsarthrobacter nasiphocae]|uniref:DNA mimic protein DMP19 C-terminal domain-containing protein n=1 Tax=Falsarthrobacter nasiphocae TaxID=189863 RepID=A0AAE3YHI5_9MICC|nr:hypothetical protein [Falsarthrobacter nasiphocae]MDR6892310.1 hypothetical protein [Falsarthrobacter nasiphocae]
MSQTPASARHVIISEESVNADADAILLSNMNVVNAMFDEHLTADEISDGALRAYYVDFYTTQLAAGGFGHLVFASAMDEDVLTYIGEGLQALGADEHESLYRAFLARYEELGEDAQEHFLSDDEDITDEDVEDDYSDDDEAADAELEGTFEAGRRIMDHDDEVTYAETDENMGAELEGSDLAEEGLTDVYESDLDGLYADVFQDLDERYEELSESQDLAAMTAAWLAAHPDLRTVREDDIAAEVAALADAVPGIEDRRSEEDDELEEHEALIFELADVADQEVEAILGYEEDFEFEGETLGAWRFRTLDGEFAMVDDGERALMVDLDTDEIVVEVEFADED